MRCTMSLNAPSASAPLHDGTSASAFHRAPRANSSKRYARSLSAAKTRPAPSGSARTKAASLAPVRISYVPAGTNVSSAGGAPDVHVHGAAPPQRAPGAHPHLHRTAVPARRSAGGGRAHRLCQEQRRDQRDHTPSPPSCPEGKPRGAGAVKPRPERDQDGDWGGRTRTSNFPVNSRAVCQLTYTPPLPKKPARPRNRCRCRGRASLSAAILRRPGSSIPIAVAIAIPGRGGGREHGPNTTTGPPAEQGSVLHPRFGGERLHRLFLLWGEALGKLDPDLHVLIAAAPVFLDPLSRNPELLSRLRARRHSQDHVPAVEGPHLDAGAE